MAIIKSLVILLRGDTGSLKKDFAKGQSEVSKFASSMRSKFAAAVPILSVAGFTAAIKQASSELDKIAKTSLSFGIDASEFIALDRAVGLAGGSTQDLEVGTRNLLRSLSEANKGTKSFQDTFGKLGVDFRELINLAPTEQFAKIAEGLQNVKSPADKVSIAMQLLGRSGTKLLPLLSNAEALRASFAETEALGGLFTSAQIGEVEKQNDAFSDLVFTMKNIVRAITIELAPSFTVIFKELTKAIQPGTAFNSMLRGIGEVAKSTVFVLNLLSSGVSILSQFLGTSIGKIVGYAIAFSVVARVMKTLITLAKAFKVVQTSLLAIESARAALNLAGAAKTVGAAAAFAGVLLAVNQLEASLAKTFEQTDKVAEKFDAIEQTSRAIKTVEINAATAGRGSQAAFETIFRQTAEMPIENLIGVTQDGNQILGEINEQLKRGARMGAELLPGDLL